VLRPGGQGVVNTPLALSGVQLVKAAFATIQLVDVLQCGLRDAGERFFGQESLVAGKQHVMAG